MKNISLSGIGLFSLATLTFLQVGLEKAENIKSDSNWETVLVVRRSLDSVILATGLIMPMAGAEVKVGSRVSGVVKSLHVKIGDVVQSGQILAELDPIELQTRSRHQDAVLTSNRAAFDYANVNLERQRVLYGKKLISDDQMDSAEKALKIAAAERDRAVVELASAEIQLDFTQILAPISGAVASISTHQGETVAAGFQTPILINILDLKRLEAWAFLDEVDVGRVKTGQRVIFSLKSFPGIDFEGKVVVVHPDAIIQNSTVNYVAAVKIENYQAVILRPEMSGSFKIFAETRQNVLIVPNRAIRWEKARAYIHVLQQNTPQQRWIKTGLKDLEATEIISGLAEGEKVVVSDIN